MHRVADLTANYLEGVGDRAVMPPIEPGAVRAALDASPPELPVGVDQILDDYLRDILPNVTHWNHPGSWRSSRSTGSAPASWVKRSPRP